MCVTVGCRHLHVCVAVFKNPEAQRSIGIKGPSELSG